MALGNDREHQIRIKKKCLENRQLKLNLVTAQCSAAKKARLEEEASKGREGTTYVGGEF